MTKKNQTEEDKRWLMGFIGYYVTYCNMCTDAPTAYSTWLGIMLLGHALGWDTQHLIQPGELHHNLYLCLIGESTVTRKTTSQNKAKDAYVASTTIPMGVTPQRLASEMSLESHNMLWYGEFAKLLKGITKSGYMSIMAEVLNELYDCPKSINLRALTEASGKKSDFPVNKAYLGFCSTTTEELLKQEMTTELMLGGFLPRHVLVEGKKRVRDRGPLPKDALDYKSDIIEILTTFMNLSAKGPVTFVLDGYVLYNRMEKKAFEIGPNVPAFAGRYMDVLVKVVDIMVVSDALAELSDRNKRLNKFDTLEEVLDFANVPRDDEGSFIVDNKFLKKAWKLIKPCIKMAEHLHAYVNLEKPVAKLRSALVKKAPIRHSSVMDKTGISSPKMKVAVQTLLEQDWIVYFEKARTSKKIKRRYTRKYYCRRELFKTEKCEKCKLKTICFAQNP